MMRCPWCGEPEFLGYYGRPEEIKFLCGGSVVPKLNTFFPSLKCEKTRIEKAVAMIQETLDHSGEGIAIEEVDISVLLDAKASAGHQAQGSKGKDDESPPLTR